ncbi:autotransporter assembly complex protein TamA [Sphingomonas nostoxanthinifaciens]|uniref:autotransporter assembly complex protein TamA n=1 Tax=Sphingomonas nostoxanthinifaciens TaxID=2872652 RepID=UPI001CC21735|nr:BamA/TamA family outer membrane protein [Sphingomonas nostoxanthinifaciens]
MAAASASAQKPTPASPPLDDRAFNEALPPLEATAPPPAPAATASPATVVDPAPADLTTPLPPLATFDPTPPAQTAAQAAASAKPSAVRYEVQISGMKAIGVEPRFKELSALLHDGKKAANAAQIRARAAEDEELAKRLLTSGGYFDGTARAAVPAAAAPGQAIPVTVTAVPGNQYHLRSITLTGLAPEPHRLATEAFSAHVGDPIVAQNIEDAEAHISLHLPEQGYPFVKVGQRDILLDDVQPVGDYTLPVDAGTKSSFGTLRTVGDPVFTIDHLLVFPRFERGQLYDSRKADDLRQALIGTSLLSTASVEPVPTGVIAPDGTQIVDVLVRQERGPSRTLSGSGGYGTGEGIKLVGEWQNRNFFPPEGALILDATAGTQQQALAATFRRSDAGLRDRTFQTGLAVSRQRFAAYSADTVDLSASLARQSTPIWQKVWTYSAGVDLSVSRENPFDPSDLQHPKATYYLASLPLQVGYDRSDSLLNPTHGFRISAKVTPTAQKQNGGGFDKYLNMLADTSGYYPIGGSLVLAARARVGSIIGASRHDIAPSRRLYSGGGGSVRGFGYQQLGPKDENNNPIGGRSLTEFAFEARYRFGNYGIVPFLDAGRVGESSMPSVSGMRYGAGIGARYYTNFGPMRFDIATPLGRKPGESKVAIYISIGQAF